MSASGTVTIRFDVQGNEKLLQSLTTLATGASQATTGVTKLQSTLGGLGVGNLGPLNNIATSVNNAGTAMTSATTKVATFKEKLAGIGTQLGQNATSFGVATASIWGVYNAYDSLEKVQIRAHAAATKVQTLETSLATLIEKRRIATEKGNLTAEQMALLDEKITNTTEKLSVAQERNADVAQDVQEAWAGFFSTVGPQVIAASGSLIQLGTVFKSTFAGGGGFINTFKNAITGLFPSLATAKAESLLLGRNIGNLGNSVTGLSLPLNNAKTAASGLGTNMAGLGGAATAATGTFGKLKMALGDVGSFLTSSKGLLLGMAGALGIAATAAVSLFHILSEGAKATAFNEKIMAGTASMKDLHDQIQSLQGLSADPFVQLEKWFFGGAIGKMIKPETTAGMSEELIKGIQAQIDVKEVGKTIQGMFDSMQPIPLGANIDFSQMSPEIQAGIQKQMLQITTIINNPTNWKAKIDPNTGKEIFSQASVQQFTINALQPLLEGLQKSVESGQFETAIQKATDGIQKKMFTAMSAATGAGALTGKTGEFAMAALQKQFAPTGFEPGSATEAAAQKAAAIRLAHNKALIAANAEYAKSVEAANKTLEDQKTATVDLNAEDVQMIKTFGGLNRSTLTNSEVRKKLLDISYKQQKGHEAEELSILDLAAANDVYSADLANLAATEGDHVTQMNNILAASINYTSALDDQDRNQKLVSEGFRDGIIQAKGFFDNLVKGTEQEAQFNAAVAEGAYSLGIHSDMLSFTSSKSQELIKSVYEMQQGYTDMSLAASKNTAFLHDNEIIQAQVTQGMIDGRTAANDWAVSLDRTIAATKAENDQLLVIAHSLGHDFPAGIEASTENVKLWIEAIKGAGGAMRDFLKLEIGDFDEFNKKMGEILTGDKVGKALKEFSPTIKKILDSLPDKAEKSLNLTFTAPVKQADAKKIVDDFLALISHVDATGKLEFKPGWINLKDKDADDVIDILLKSIKKTLPSQMEKTDPWAAFIADLKSAKSKKNSAAAIQELFTPERLAALNLNGDQIAILLSEDIPPEVKAQLIEGASEGAKAASAQKNAIFFDLLSAQTRLPINDPQNFKPSPLSNALLEGRVREEATNIFNQPKTPVITPPAPVVFPPPDLTNILTGVSKAEIMMSEMVKYAAGLTISFPLPDIGNVITAVSHAQIAAGDVVTYVAGLTISFPEPTTDNVITGVSKAQIVTSDLVTYIAGLPLVFPGIDIVGIANSTSSASKAAATLVPDIAGLKPVFPGVNIVGVVNSTSSAKKAAATLVTDISNLKPAFPGVNIIGVVNSTTNAKNAASKLEGHIASLKLKFPGIDISNITSSVNSAQSKIDSLHGKTIENHVKTVFDNAGGNILNDMRIASAAAGKLFTTNGEQLFRVGDNPGGRETIAMIPHDKPSTIMEKLNQMFPNVNSTLHERARRPAMQTISTVAGGGGAQRSGPTVVNVTTEVYLFPGSDMFKKFVKSIMLEEMSRYAAV